MMESWRGGVRLVGAGIVTVGLLVGIGCDGIDLPDEGHLDRTRLLAARSDPAALSPGQPARLSAYAWAPSGTPVVVWCLPTGCDPRDPLVDEAVAVADAGGDGDDDLRARAWEAGIVGVEPGLSPQLVAPEERLVLAVYAVPPRGNDVEEAVWEGPRADPAEPANRHPVIEAVTQDGVPVDTVAMPSGASIELALTYDLGSEEDDDDLDVQWFTDAPPTEGGGGPGPDVERLFGDGTLALTVDAAHEGVVVAVVRDGRGGVDWIEVPLAVSAR